MFELDNSIFIELMEYLLSNMNEVCFKLIKFLS